MKRPQAGRERATVKEVVKNRPVSACSGQVGEQVVRPQLATTKRTSLAQGVPRPLSSLPCPASATIILTLSQNIAVLKASIPASPAENDVALSRHCAGCRPHPSTRGAEDLRSCCCALQARGEHRVIMLTRRRPVSIPASTEAAPPSASTRRS